MKEPAGLASLLLDAGCTPRQSEVLFLAADGLTFQEIATRLSLSFECVKSHASSGRRRVMDYGEVLERRAEVADALAR